MNDPRVERQREEFHDLHDSLPRRKLIAALRGGLTVTCHTVLPFTSYIYCAVTISNASRYIVRRKRSDALPVNEKAESPDTPAGNIKTNIFYTVLRSKSRFSITAHSAAYGADARR